MVLKPLRFYQTQGVLALSCVHLDVAVSLIIKHFAGKEDFLLFKISSGKTIITNGNDIIIATLNQQLFSKNVWAVYGEEMTFRYYTFMLPEEY